MCVCTRGPNINFSPINLVDFVSGVVDDFVFSVSFSAPFCFGIDLFLKFDDYIGFSAISSSSLTANHHHQCKAILHLCTHTQTHTYASDEYKHIVFDGK